MAVMEREAWTDRRLDDFRENVNHRFDEVEGRFDRVEGDVRELRSEIHAHRGETKDGFAEVNKRIDSIQQTIVVCFSGMTASIVGAILVTQL